MKIGKAFKKIAKSIKKAAPKLLKTALKATALKAFGPLSLVKSAMGLAKIPKLFSAKPLAFLRPLAAPFPQAFSPLQLGQSLGRAQNLAAQGTHPGAPEVVKMLQLLQQLQSFQPNFSAQIR